LNSKTYLSSIKVQVMESLRSIQHAPGVQMQEVRLSLLVVDYVHLHLLGETFYVKWLCRKAGSVRSSEH
jgi:hypothetical protein